MSGFSAEQNMASPKDRQAARKSNLTSRIVFLNEIDDKFNLLLTQLIEQRQAYQAVGIHVAARQLPDALTIILGVVVALVQRKVMERSNNIMFLQISNQARTFLQITADEVEHVAVVCGIARNLRQADFPLGGDALQPFEVLPPDSPAFVLDFVEVLELCP